MLLVERRVWVDHFGLDPDAELEGRGAVEHGEVVDLLDVGAETVWEFRGIWGPVAEAKGIVVTRVFDAEPAVVVDEEFDAEFFCFAGELDERGLVDVEA